LSETEGTLFLSYIFSLVFELTRSYYFDMPRQARLDTAGALHHVMVRGINKSAIFGDNQDRQNFLERLSINLMDSNCYVYAWALMNNHVHLLFKSGGRGLSDVVRKQLTWYAMYISRKYHRVFCK
jgi:putative transposase